MAVRRPTDTGRVSFLSSNSGLIAAVVIAFVAAVTVLAGSRRSGSLLPLLVLIASALFFLRVQGGRPAVFLPLFVSFSALIVAISFPQEEPVRVPFWLRFALPFAALLVSITVISARFSSGANESPTPRGSPPLAKETIPSYMKLDTVEVSRRDGAFVIALPDISSLDGRLVRTITLFDHPLKNTASVIVEQSGERALLDTNAPGPPEPIESNHENGKVLIRIPAARLPAGLCSWYGVASSTVGYALEGSFNDPRPIDGA